MLEKGWGLETALSTRAIDVVIAVVMCCTRVRCQVPWMERAVLSLVCLEGLELCPSPDTSDTKYKCMCEGLTPER